MFITLIIVYFRYVKFDPLGQKLITGIANVKHDRGRFDLLSAAPCGLAGHSGGHSRYMSGSRFRSFGSLFGRHRHNRDRDAQDHSNQDQSSPSTSSFSRTGSDRMTRLLEELRDRNNRVSEFLN